MTFERTVKASPEAVGQLRRAAASCATEAGLDEDAVAGVALAVSEAATNALIHGYREQKGTITLRVETTATAVRIAVEDAGSGLAPRCDSPGLGLGLGLIATVAEHVEISARNPGTAVAMTFARPDGAVAAERAAG